MASSSYLASLFGLSGQVAVVTGGAGRLGSRYVRALVEAGAWVASFDLAGRVSADVDALIAGGQPVSAHAVDVTSRAAVDAAIADVAKRFGTPTILVNNAGLGSSPADAALETGRFERYPESAWDAMIESHLKSAFVTSQSFIEGFRAAAHRAASGGSIINISSTYGIVSPDQSLYEYRRRGGEEYFKPVGYSVAKSGVLNFTRWLAEYGAPLGIRVNTLVPGGVRETSHAPEFVAEYEKRTPIGRMATETDYDGAIVFLASQASAYMTGAMLVIDGGWTAR
ncbi:MAG TPA: SDR family oxidoreductase [Vicinamibacterales bacterium]|nr:SDR family oxidoreductase [Vicinamibacterales bacterium]